MTPRSPAVRNGLLPLPALRRLLFAHMDAVIPWSEYSEDELPRGFSQAVGCDEVDHREGVDHA